MFLLQESETCCFFCKKSEACCFCCKKSEACCFCCKKSEACLFLLQESELFLTLHCHHHSDFCITKGNDENHFNVSVIVKGKVSHVMFHTW